MSTLDSMECLTVVFSGSAVGDCVLHDSSAVDGFTSMMDCVLGVEKYIMMDAMTGMK